MDERNDDVEARKEAKARAKEAEDRQRAKAVRMSREGASFETIGQRLGVTRLKARQMVFKELDTIAKETDAGKRRVLHVEVLMDLWRVLYTPAAAGDGDAIDRFLQVEQRLSSLLGLDRATDGGGASPQPVQILVGSTDGSDTLEVANGSFDEEREALETE